MDAETRLLIAASQRRRQLVDELLGELDRALEVKQSVRVVSAPGWGRLRIRVKSGHKAGVGPARIRLVISPTTPRLTLPATFL